MALLFMDGFDAGDVNLKWNFVQQCSISASTRFSSGRSISLSTNTGFIQKTFTPSAQIFVGFAAYRSSTTSSQEIFAIRGDNGATEHLKLYYTTTGAVLIERGTTTLAISDPGFVVNDTWVYLEVWATIADSGGRCIVRVNGVTAIDFTGDTKNGGTSTNIDSVLCRSVLSVTTLIDDVYICDATGPAPYNTFLGDVRVATLVPDGAGSDTGFTPSTGANYQTVDELPFSATDYVSASASGTRDLYTMSNLSGSYNVLAVQQNIIAKKTDAGGTAIKPAVKSGGTVYYGANATLASSDTSIRDLRTTDPATGAAWTQSGVNALESGMEIV